MLLNLWHSSSLKFEHIVRGMLAEHREFLTVGWAQSLTVASIPWRPSRLLSKPFVVHAAQAGRTELVCKAVTGYRPMSEWSSLFDRIGTRC